MASSLKAALPSLAPILGESADALYSHQRAFVAAGLLESVPGRGPGSGTPGTPATIATFLICMLTRANIAENVPFARSIADAVPEGGVDALTSASTFKDALAAVLSDEKLSARVGHIQIQMNGGYAKVGWERTPTSASDKPVKITVRAPPLDKPKRRPRESLFRGNVVKVGMEVTITLSADMVHDLSKAVLALRRW
jgi:hypothetical protein